ncbi:2-methylcitrate dehydratase PrpD [Actinoplanes tereljensis]|uniref:MmgE/Prp family protein n=1 Tax=Paractinoplanes tereljensis TaxID=571912 RepID=A0A919NZD0_9ACTN|nr:MmgE/PrpD family protein [Actinoplanes tereljensis]GIF26097.1 MmgE/Prp family protein [Actinoplanes tereljensis]
MTSEPAAVVLARWASDLRYADLPLDVVDAARRHLVDAVGCAVAGIRRGAADPALTVASSLGGPPEARLFTGERLGAVAAAFGNAVAVHALDFDDTHPGGLVHASAVTVPVALAVGADAAWEELITALVAGLETVCRLGAAVPHGFHRRGLHATSICGPVAAAVVAGKLLRFDEPAMTAAIGIAASGASGLLEFLHSPASTKQLHPGTAVANGILAARLAAAGATGPAGALDGTYGLYRALADRAPDLDVLLGGLGTRWAATGIAVKPYPCCQLSHASLDAARAFAGAAPATVTIRLHPDAIPIVAEPAKRAPRSAYEAKFSVYFVVAAMIIDGRVDLDTFDHLDRPEILDLAARITVVPGPAEGVPADAPGDLDVEGHRSVVDHAAGPGVRTKAAANLGPAAPAVFDAVDSGADAAQLLDAIEGCLK